MIPAPWLVQAKAALAGAKLALLAVAVTLVFALGFGSGWKIQGYRADAAKLKVAEAAQKLKRETDLAMEQERARGDRLAQDLEVSRRNVRTVTVEVVKQVPKVTTVYVEVPGETPQAIPDAVFTRGFVRLWNESLFADSVEAAGQPAGAPVAANDLVRARINQADVLNNHVINAGRDAECRAQLNALIDWHLGHRVRDSP